MLNFIKNLRKILSFTQDSMLPALIFMISILAFYIFEETIPSILKTLNITFYSLCLISCSILIYFNKTKALIFILLMMLSYIAINYLKLFLGTDYLSSSYFINISILVPLNFCFCCFLPNNKLTSKENIYIILGIFMQIALIENISPKDINFGYNVFTSHKGLNNLSLLFFVITNILILIKSSVSARIIDISLLFAFLGITFGFIYSDNPTALIFFFLSSALIVFIGICYDTHYETYKDVLTGLLNRNSFITHSKKLPLKYDLGIINIDDYQRLTTIFSAKEIKDLTKMISNKISENDENMDIYRYSKDEFVILFKDSSPKENFAELDEIRRQIASSKFVLSKRKKTINLTVSGSITSKKRSDANAFVVLGRAKKSLEQTNKFSQNVTSKS